MPFDGSPGVLRACGAPDPKTIPRATIDFEARNVVSVVDVGSWRYSEDPACEIICLCYRLPYWPAGRVDVWHPAFPEWGVKAAPPPLELFLWIQTGGLVEAHNAQMERAMWLRICVEQMGWPEVPHRSWRCSASKACALALPRALEDVARVLRCAHLKDSDGHKLMMRLCRPRKVLKKERKALLAEGRTDAEVDAMVLYHGSNVEFWRVVDYCKADVLAEEEVSWHLRDLNETETEVFLLDAAMNERGVHFDREAIDAALALVDLVTGGMTAELPALTKDADPPVERASQRARLMAWVNGRGVPMMDTQGPTVDGMLERGGLPDDVRRVLEICREVNRSSTAKYVAMRDRICRDDRIRGMMLYHGASTGRWSGAGVQPHNFPRGDLISSAMMDRAWENLLEGDVDWIEFLHGEIMEVLSHATRGAIMAPAGYQLMVADYVAIEARVVMWLADQENALRVLADPKSDIYCVLASEIYGRTITKLDKDERQLGKQAILGLGFGMGAQKFVDTCAKYNTVISLEFAQRVVDLYRTMYSRVKRMWYDQEAAAIEATRSGRTIRCGKITWRVVGRFLHARLPSGRMLSYCDPAVLMEPPPWGGDPRPVLTFMAVDPYTRKWTRQSTYGGSLIENLVQAIARDLLAEAMLRAEATGVYVNAFSVHDEVVAYVPLGATRADVGKFEALMSINPPWAQGCPVRAEGWTGLRYHK